MLLGRLRIRSRLLLLVLVPLFALVQLAIGTSIELGSRALRAAETAAAVRVASVVDALVRALQEERLLSVGLLDGKVTRRELLRAVANTGDAARLAADAGTPAVRTAVGTVAGLQQLRTGVMNGFPGPAETLAAYSGVITGLLESTRLLDVVDGDTAQGRQVLALDAVTRANEGFATILAVMATADSPGIVTAYVAGLATLQPAVLRFVTYASPEQVQLYGYAVQAVDARLGQGFANGLVTNPGIALATLSKPPPFASIVSLTQVGRGIETKIINDAIAAAEHSAFLESVQAFSFLGGSTLTMLLTALLGAAVARSVARPVRRLTYSAERVARLAETELVRVADDDSPEADPVRLQPIEVTGRDELADFARAFGRVQETAAMLVQRQVASRRNVAQMFGHVGRRTQNLVGRQVALIDKLESAEVEPERLGDLYRLDHISSRLRRSANSLVVLSGETGTDDHVAPLALADVVRLALAEIEDYPRVDVDVTTSVQVAPALINDLVLVLAELMENATTFSPPGTRVRVAAASTRVGARITVVDQGLGMTEDRLAEENARLTRRERLDLAPTEVLGLFVVGRLARRHGLTVSLAPTPQGGVTAAVDVPAPLLTASPALTQVSLTQRRSREARVSAMLASTGTAVPGSEVAVLARPGGVLARPGGVLAAADPAVFDVQALDRATRTMRAVRPWNAFGSPARTGAASEAGAPSPVAGDAAPHRAAPEAAALDVRASTIRPAVPRASTLNRRVPGKTLEELEGTGPSAPTQFVPPEAGQPSAEEARDSLAQFESGVARAMREMDSRDEGSA